MPAGPSDLYGPGPFVVPRYDLIDPWRPGVPIRPEDRYEPPPADEEPPPPAPAPTPTPSPPAAPSPVTGLPEVLVTARRRPRGKSRFAKSRRELVSDLLGMAAGAIRNALNPFRLLRALRAVPRRVPGRPDIRRGRPTTRTKPERRTPDRRRKPAPIPRIPVPLPPLPGRGVPVFTPKPTPKPAPKPTPKPAPRQLPKPVIAPKPLERPSSKPVTRPAPRPVPRPSPVPRSFPSPIFRPAALPRPIFRPAARPAVRPAPRPRRPCSPRCARSSPPPSPHGPWSRGRGSASRGSC